MTQQIENRMKKDKNNAFQIILKAHNLFLKHCVFGTASGFGNILSIKVIESELLKKTYR